MGGALLKGWVARGIAPVAAVEPAPSPELQRFARRNAIRLLTKIDDAAGWSLSACVIALKPQVLQSEAPNLRPIAQSGALMLSIAAGTSIAALRKAWGRDAAIVRAMPNTPGAIGRGISVLYAPPGTRETLRERSQTLLEGLGETLWVGRETLIDAVTAVSGSGPAYVFLLAECLAHAARREGLSGPVADRLARITVSGAGALLESDSREPASLRRDVTSPGGTTEAALKVLTKNDAFGNLVVEAVAGARARAAELRKRSEK
jgi:pyrroline-5-carboxylate reductase